MKVKSNTKQVHGICVRVKCVAECIRVGECCVWHQHSGLSLERFSVARHRLPMGIVMHRMFYRKSIAFSLNLKRKVKSAVKGTLTVIIIIK